MNTIIMLYIVLMLILSIVDLKKGIAMYLAYIILVPFMNINIAGVTFQWNMINLFFILLYFFTAKIKGHKTDYKPFIPFFIYFIGLLVIMPFQDKTPIIEQFSTWRANFMQVIIMPLILWNITKYDNRSVSLFNKALLVSIGIAILYGLFLIITPGLNPYITLISIINGSEFNAEYALADGEGRMFGRISSVFSHPMTFGLFLGFAFIYVYSIYEKTKDSKIIFALLAILAAIFTCGIRSPIAAIFITIFLYLLINRNIKLVLQIAIMGTIIYYIISLIPDFNEYIQSISEIDSRNSSVKGSSIEMRIEQFYGCINEIKDNFIVGNGYGWTGYYKKIHGDHPVMLAFESLFYVILCNSGICGVFIWLGMSLSYYKTTKRITKNKKEIQLILALGIYYLSYATITGEYGYMKFFALIYTIMLINKITEKEIPIRNTKTVL